MHKFAEIVEEPQDIVVIGAGVIGISCAIELQAEGHQVVVLDRKGVGAEASRENAGAFAFSDVLPLASPGIMKKAPKWLLDPTGPLSIPVTYAPYLIPWMWKLWRACQQGKVSDGIAAQYSLMKLSRNRLFPFMDKTLTRSMLHQDGNLQLYETDSEFRSTLPSWAVRESYRIPFRHVDGAAEIAKLQPGISEQFTKATFTPEWYRISDPFTYVTKLSVSGRKRVA